MKNTMKMIASAVSNTENGQRTAEFTPKRNGFMDTESAQKRKSPGGNLEFDMTNVILNVSDDDEDLVTKKVCVSEQPTKYENTTHAAKPQLPPTWTQASSSVPKKEVLPAMLICQSNLKGTDNYQVNRFMLKVYFFYALCLYIHT